MLTWLGNHWKLVALGLAILLIAYGVWSRTDKTLFNMLATQYRQDESQAIKDRDEELAKLDKERDSVLNQLAQVQKEKDSYAAKYNDINKKYLDLVDAVGHIVVPTDLNAIIDDLHKHGYSSATRAPRPNSK
jgi:uncharacterized coiled-coil DUF342 family protein